MKKFQLIVTAYNGKHINTHDIEAADKKHAALEAMEIMDGYRMSDMWTQLAEL